jgi:opacity protein-like surface antigen
MTRRSGTGVLLAAAALLTLSSAVAEAVERQSSPWIYAIRGGTDYHAPADMDSGGDFDVARWFVQPSVGYAWNRRTSVSLSVGGGESYYGFSGSAGLGGGDPWGTIRDLRLSLPVRFSPLDAVDVFVVPTVRTVAERGADLDDGRTEGVLGGFLWRFGKNFAIGPGVGWFTEIEGGSKVFPILLIDWDITDRLKLSIGNGLGASEGPGLTVSWKADDNLTIGLSGRHESASFRLDGSGAAPDGIGTDERFPLVASVQYSPWPMASVSAFAGVAFGGELELQNGNGRTVDSTDYDATPIFGATFALRF